MWRPCYDLVSSITDLLFEYLGERYDFTRRMVPSLKERKFDFVFATALQTHLTGPHYFHGLHRPHGAAWDVLHNTSIPGEDPLLRLRITAARRRRLLSFPIQP